MSSLAESQHGVVARWQLLALRFGPRAIDRRLERGILHRVHRGVYAVGHPLLTPGGRLCAAALACGRDAVLSHRSAAELWQLLHPSGRAIEVTRSTGWCGPKGIVLHRSSIPDDERAVVDGIPVTSLPRTILDLAAVVSTRRVERALNEMEVRGLTDRLSVPDLLERYPGRRGSAVLRRLLGDRATFVGVTQNDLEELFLGLVDSHGLPRPRVNTDISVRGRFFRPDFLWAEQRLIVELDGRGVHGTAAAFEGDRERDRILLTEGWRVMRATWRQLRDRPDVLAADLRRALSGVAGSTL